MAYRPWNEREAAAVIAAHRRLRGPLLPVLHGLMERFGYIDDGAVALVAEALDLSRAEVHGTISFYRDFRRAPPPRRVIRICRAEACQAAGGEALTDHVRTALGLDHRGTGEDGETALEAVYCLGNCALSPAVTIDGRLHGRVDAERFDRLLAESRR